ncbi:cytochrome P450 [Aestuariicella hydrocarbonica]|uniref:Cytochrome P450 n=1 Tax=Pseudomaricurvus hydrocarbonicus TaxID=1470433 RepID=A0A9E5JWK3_9GAMM|nr:cytochrome P450 [Aestuariicella hydrocarbonica]NHO65891.1 cytochrome P450 [Aestuariicella hydrocarbonica]
MTTQETQAPTSSGCPFTGRQKVALEETSLTDPIIQANPRDFYWTMRTEDPVHYDEKLGMWLVTRYDDIVKVLREPLLFSDKQGYEAQYASGFFEEFKQILESQGGGYFPDVIKSDPPEHTRIRKLMDGAFSAHRVKTLEPGITRIIADLVDQIADKADKGEVIDGVREFAIPLTISVICEQLGIDQFNGEKISRWSEAITAQIGRMQNREEMVENAKEICDLQNFITEQMQDREVDPKEDMISDLVHAELDDGSKLTFGEAVSLVRALIIAGNDTTATAITNLLLILATQPELAQELYDNVEDDKYLNRFVEELLRFAPPVRGLAKMATEDTELGGQQLPKGAHLLVMYASGNDDEEKFECPRQFDMGRKNLGSHVAFGVGVHRCIGASLARMEIKVAAKELIKKVHNIQLTVPVAELKYQKTVATHAIEALPITFTKR